MGKMIAYCGIICTECLSYIATQTKNNELLVKTAECWSKEFGVTCTPEDISCDGCKSDSVRLCNHCSECKIRECCKNKGLENCAYCCGYICNELNKFFKWVPEAKATLDDLKKSI
ncbi:MAG: DUF3795 domain-containing protein [Candidatus Thermoplasmatota archaeon]|nr:DUF3795 domain-containing protein [Candidatus Thermoplasmatota archaeon]